MKKKYYIGIASTFHDPSISIIDNKGEILFAESTERYLQDKRATGNVADPVIWTDQVLRKYCDIDAEFHIATSWSNAHFRNLKLLNLLGIYNRQPEGAAKFIFDKALGSMQRGHNIIWYIRLQMASNIQAGASIERNIRVNYRNDKVYLHRYDHHTSHASMSAFTSGFDEAVCMVADGTGEMGTIACFEYKNGTLKRLKRHRGSESLGTLYGLITTLCGFSPVKGEEWKVMGMAPYGKKDDIFYQLLNSILEVKSFNLKFINNLKHIENIIKKINQILINSNQAFEVRANLACTGQLLICEYLEQLIKDLYDMGVSDNLVYAGGCALNSSFNGKILPFSKFKNLYVPSAPGDDGNSIGAAFLAYHEDNPILKPNFVKFQTPYLGSEIMDSEVEQFIKYSGYYNIKHYPNDIYLETAKLLAEGKLIGWVQGRAEFGPRALGNRSILADPRPEDMKDKINSRVKFREEFRPFAPSILDEFGNEYFENYQESPYMERTLKYRDDVLKKIPAVVHVDNTGRLQTVKKEWNEQYYMLIKSFYEITGIPLVLNTSYNVMGKPIIHSFNDALNVFFNSGLDVLVVNNYMLTK